MIGTFIGICTLHSCPVAYYDSAQAQISGGQARASPPDYQGRRLPCWVRDVLAQLFFKASNTVRTIILINYQIKIFFHEIKIFLATKYYIITSTHIIYL